MRITFMDDESEKIIFVDDWRELGYYYRRYKGENIIRCAKCGKLERGNKNGTIKLSDTTLTRIDEYLKNYNF